MSTPYLFAKPNIPHPFTLLHAREEFGYATVTLVEPPRRFFGESTGSAVGVDDGLDIKRVQALPLPTQVLQNPAAETSWQTLSRRSVARLYAYYLLAEDPHQRLVARPVETLLHQVSLVQHILQSENLRRLLIADEVGLGKTVEAGLLLQELLTQKPSLRVLYLAPARLVSNVRREFDRLGFSFRCWAAQDSDARLEADPRIIASIHRAVHGKNPAKILATPAWDVVVVDECHHLSAWSPEAGDPTQTYSLVRKLMEQQPATTRLILMSGTPHQGHNTRFQNLLRLLRQPQETTQALSGRVIYRTKDDVTGWDGHPLFPSRQVNKPLSLDLSPAYRQWLQAIHDFYRPPYAAQSNETRRRAAGWRCAQAMQWAVSSPHAGLGYLVRQAVRAGWALPHATLERALAALRPYRLGLANEPVNQLYARIEREVDRQQTDATEEDIEEYQVEETDWFDPADLEALLLQGIQLVQQAGAEKWEFVYDHLLANIGPEKVVLFAQPIETVTALARFLEKKTGQRPALILGGQDDATRSQEVRSFWEPAGPQFLVSSRAGGEGINLQVARRLIHIDVPWNPMDLEQRVGRVHRFGSRETILVDTVVVKNSREAQAYDAARAKLQLIAQTLVPPERFEAVYSRVMALLPNDELQTILLNSPAGPLSASDQQHLAELVQSGFASWRSFHEAYSQAQKAIQSQNPGLATWEDVIHFLEKFGGAKRHAGFQHQHFRRQGQAVTSHETAATVLRLRDDKDYVVSDHPDSQTHGPQGLVAQRLGLNVEAVREILLRHAFPEQPVGAAYLRWPSEGLPLPADCVLPLGLLVFARQTLQSDKKGGWLEIGLALHLYTLPNPAAAITEVAAEATKATLLRGLFNAVIPTKAAEHPALVAALAIAEPPCLEALRRPTPQEMEHQVRHAVTPLFAGVVTK